MNKDNYYSEKQILNYLGRSVSKSLGVNDLTRYCRNAGLIIAPVAETLKGPGSRILYQIIDDNFLIEGEEWVNCCFSDKHEVSNLGRVRDKLTKRLLGYKNSKGYLSVGFGQQSNLALHRVIYFSFHPELLQDKDFYVIDHINGKRDDNRIENLRAISNLENVKEGKQNQKDCQTILAQLLLKYGYEETQQKLEELLNSN